MSTANFVDERGRILSVDVTPAVDGATAVVDVALAGAGPPLGARLTRRAAEVLCDELARALGVDAAPCASAFRAVVRRALAKHVPAGKDYAQGVKVCACGHRAPIGAMSARTRHLEDVIVDALEGRA